VKRERLTRQLVGNPTLLVWAAFVAMIPFYILPSGLPQPGDGLILVLLPVALYRWNGRLNHTLLHTLRPLVWFTVWVCLVDYGWALVEWKWTEQKAYTIFPIYYIFNLAVFACALIAFQRFGEAFLKVTLYVVFGAVMFQVAVSFLYRTDLYRSALFFNNANQLGYYALLAASLIALTQKRVRFGLFKASLGLTGCAYLALMSASRAAVVGILILFFLLVFSNPRIIIVASIAAAGLLTLGGPVAKAIDNVEARMNRQTKTGFMEERGYDRIWTYKEYMIIGAGEGDVTRFDQSKHAREIHSSFATVLFSYGIIGIGLFLAFMWRAVRGASLRAAFMLVPMLAYTIAHQGLRFTMLWVLLAVFVTLKVPPRPAAASVPRRAIDPAPSLVAPA
jgi:hypothetical protein